MGVSIDIATMVDDLLHEKAPRLLTAKNLSAAIRSHLGQGSGEGLRRRLHDALCSTVGEKTVEQMNISAVTLDRFVGKRAHMRPISNPIQSLLVIRALFGGWEGLERAMDLTDPDEVLGRPRLLFKRGERNVQALRRKRYSEFYHSLPEPEALALRNKYRQWLRDILDQDATLARKDLPKFAGYYSAINHLMSIDGDWFETMLPNRIARKSGPRFLEDETKKMQVAERVEQVIANIFARRDLAIETNPLSRITKSYLISAVGSIYENRGVKDDPDVEKALNDCIDTYESLRTRITLDIVKRVRVRDSRHRWADESWWFPHSRVAFASHATRARRWLRKAE
ncbi:hypothetical protein [Paraburkholderia caribensis]|uniref:hypothetical protein n=1 Tax=Paraburkholderia caribensis TaxID=75105 RepID=UPI001CC48D33|nr:hypothetical protein [Paraburkholderia caribensis]